MDGLMGSLNVQAGGAGINKLVFDSLLTPLHLALSKVRLHNIFHRLSLQSPILATVNVLTKLSFILFFLKGKFDIAKKLIEAGADVNLVSQVNIIFVKSRPN